MDIQLLMQNSAAPEFWCGRRLEAPGHGKASKPEMDQYTVRGKESEPHCNYCGSITAARFFQLVDYGCEVVPTDKNYKVYIAGQKFYFQHFADADVRKFVDLYNNKKMKLGYPHHFYVMPFFAAAVGVAGVSDTGL